MIAASHFWSWHAGYCPLERKASQASCPLWTLLQTSLPLALLTQHSPLASSFLPSGDSRVL